MLPALTIATRNQGKIDQFARILGIKIIGKDLKIQEIQSEDPLEVLSQKAKDAYRLNNNQAIVVEDSVIQCPALYNLPGPFVDQFTNTLDKRKLFCELLNGKERTALFQVGVALFDGKTVQFRLGKMYGNIAAIPKGSDGFGFDDIFIPDGQDGDAKTYAEMSPEFRDKFSPRRIAIEGLRREPFL